MAMMLAPCAQAPCGWRRVQRSKTQRRRACIRACSIGMSEEDALEEAERMKLGGARAKRLEKVRIFEDLAHQDEEVREILGDSIGNPKAMEKKIKDRVLRKGQDIFQPKTGTAVPLPVHFRDFDPAGGYIWFELCSVPTEKDLDTIGGVFRSWYVLGKLGAFNSLRMQMTDLPVDAIPHYDPIKAKNTLPAYFHNMGDIEYQDTYGRVWVDLGTSDPIAWDIIINSLSALSSDHVGMKQVVFGGDKFLDWEEGMKETKDGYKVYKI